MDHEKSLQAREFLRSYADDNRKLITDWLDGSGNAEDVMADAGVVRNGVFDNARMGRLLRKLEGKIIGGLRLSREGTAQN
ncbi:MAG: hypothetical protein VXZ67_03315, partial [Pseudomonadota bacterium]|nr:hypothetical protein [Pseudomonadota bacterium]